MKLFFLAQTALGLTLKDAFNVQFAGTDIATHGCHCARLSGAIKSAANSISASGLDSHCHDWQRARNCAKFSSECESDDGDYESGVACENQANPCRKLVCNLDAAFVQRIYDESGTDFSAQAQCSYDLQAPQNNPQFVYKNLNIL